MVATPRRGGDTRTPGLVVILATLSSSLLALDPRTHISDYTMDVWRETEGLPQSHVKAVIHARDGYLWVGTKAGLARFDGVRFTVFDDRVPGQLREGEVWALLEDRDGALWIGTFGGGLSHYQDGRFTTYTRADGLAGDFVTSLEQCGNGDVWIGTDTGLSRRSRGELSSYSRKDGLPTDRVTALYCDAEGVLWIGTSQGLSSFAEGRFTNTPLGFQGETRVTAIVPDGGKGLWLGRFPGGVTHFESGAVTHYGREEGLTHESVGDLWRDRHGTLWIATGDGLCRLRDDKISCYQPRLDSGRLFRPAALQALVSLAEDRQGNLWVGSVHHGLTRVKDSVFEHYGEQDGIPGDGAHAVVETRDGAVWVGGLAGLVRFEGEKATVFTMENGLTNNSIRTLHEDKDGTLWIGTAAGLNIYRNGRIEPVRESGLDKPFVYVVLRDQRGDLWVGTNGQGLFHGWKGRFRVYTEADGLAGKQIRGLQEDPEGNIWIGTKDGGLTRWRDGTFTRYSERLGTAGNAVQALYVDGKGALWISMRSGLCRLQGETATTYTAQNGLPSNFVYQMMEDAGGDVWLTSARGIFRIAKAEMDALIADPSKVVHPVSYGPETGLKDAALAIGCYPSIWRAHDGRLWFTGLKGVSVIDPAHKAAKTADFPVHIEEAGLDGAPVTAGGAYGPGRGNLEMRFTGIDLYAPEQVTFRYRLEGFDADWVNAGTRRVAYYTNLPPGVFRFQVQAADHNGAVSSRTAALTFTLAPHAYQTAWFRAGVVILLLLLGWTAHRLRLTGHERRERQLQARIDEAVAKVHVLDGLLPICAWCKRVREDTGYWRQVEAYVAARSRAQFSHGICPDCVEKYYPETHEGEKAENEPEPV